MRNVHKTYRPAFGAIVIYLLCCVALFPLFKNVITPDDVSYMRIAEYYAKGDFANAINGYWSPLNSWIGAALSTFAIPPLFLYKYILIANGCIVIFLTYRLGLLFSFSAKYQSFICIGLIPLLLQATYMQLCGDFLQLSFLLLYCNLIFSPRYTQQIGYAVLCGLIAVFAFYAKYYSFYFSILHLVLCNGFLFLFLQKDKERFVKYTVLSIAVLILGVCPWVYFLSEKYGSTMFNYVDHINASWYLTGQKSYPDNIIGLLPPKNLEAFSYWEDPFYIQGSYSYFWQSPMLFIRQLFLILKNSVVFLQILSAFSPFLFFIFSYTTYRCFFSKKAKTIEWLSLITFICLPLGYLFIHIEQRFILLLGIIGFMLGIYYISNLLLPQIKSTPQKRFIIIIYIISFAINPAYELVNGTSYGNKIVHNAQEINALTLPKGSYVTNNPNAVTFIQAYLIKMPIYAVEKRPITKLTLETEMKKYKIRYYFEDQNFPSLFPDSKNHLRFIDRIEAEGLSIYQWVE